MRDEVRTARVRAIDWLANMPRLHIDWLESAHDHREETQNSDVGGIGTLVTAIVVLCTCVLAAVLTAVMMMWS